MFIMIDVEADGPIPGEYSMIAFAAVVCRDSSVRFRANLRPVTEKYMEDALRVANFTREETLGFDNPENVMKSFRDWLSECNPKRERLFFISDNNGFDWQFMNYYFWRYLDANPFGHSSFNLGSFYKGLIKDAFQNFKHLRETPHSHDPLDDALGNVEALKKIIQEFEVKIRL